MFAEVVETLEALADSRATRLAMDTFRALHVRLGRMLVSDTPPTPDADTRSEPTLDATHLGLRVTLVGGAVGGQTVAQGDPNTGGADAWPVKVDAALPAGSNSIGTVVLGAGTAKIGKVTDQPLTLAGVGQKTTTSSGAVTSGVSGAGYLTILNTDASLGAYLGTGTVDNTKFLLSAGASVTWPISDVTTVNCFGTGAVLSWAFLQVA